MYQGTYEGSVHAKDQDGKKFLCIDLNFTM